MFETLLQTSGTPLGERLLVAIVGPLVSAILGTGVIGFILWKLSQKADVNRTAVEDARAKHEFEGALRHDVLKSGLTESTALYLATQHYWRVKEDPQIGSDEKGNARSKLNEQYLHSRTAVKVLETRLEALFETQEPALEWHRIDDLLTVRYMQLTGNDTEHLYRINERGYEGKRHSGLSVDELKDPEQLLREYHRAVGMLLLLS